LNAWQDSAPVVFISGNVRLSHCSSYINKTKNVNIRKYGVQEHDIVKSVKSITKYSVFIESPDRVPYELEKAIHIALSARRGPVWLDIPSDVQTAMIQESHPVFNSTVKQIEVDYYYHHVAEEIRNSSRPIIVVGNGIHLSDSRKEFIEMVEHHNVPFVSSYLARDLAAFDHRLNLGAIGIKGSRAANFAMQNADLLVIMGCSMNATHVGYDEKQFAPHARKLMIDIDENEILKGNVKIDRFFQTDLKAFFKIFTKKMDSKRHYENYLRNEKYFT
jgi:acetolactate synthase-1/2/3 large subunit